MSELDKLTEQFGRLLEDIHAKYSLEEWQYAYREVIYRGAMKILGEFPELIVGPRPQSQQQQQPGTAFGGVEKGEPGRGPPARSDSTKPPYRPSGVGEVLCIILGVCPQHS